MIKNSTIIELQPIQTCAKKHFSFKMIINKIAALEILNMLATYNALGFIVIREVSNKIFWVVRGKLAILECREC
jgi:hypothetical protein